MKYLPLLLVLFLASCAGSFTPIVTEEGCPLFPIDLIGETSETEDKPTYFVGRCPDSRTVVQWSAGDNFSYQLHRWDDGEIRYKRWTPQTGWQWVGSKEPIPPDSPPQEVLENQY